MNTLWSRVYSEGFGSTTSSSKGEESAASSPSVEPPVAESSDEHPSLQPAVVEAASAAPTTSFDFEGVDPSLILQQLIELPPSEVVVGKPFWKTYSKWEKLDACVPLNFARKRSP